MKKASAAVQCIRKRAKNLKFNELKQVSRKLSEVHSLYLKRIIKIKKRISASKAGAKSLLLLSKLQVLGHEASSKYLEELVASLHL